MLARLGLAVLCISLIGADAADDKLKDTLVALEKKLIEAIKQKDKKAIAALLGNEAYSITAAGGLRTGPEHLKDLEDLELSDYSLTEAKVVAVGKDGAILTYVFSWKGKFKGKENTEKPVYATVVWALKDGKWTSVFYQETPMERK